MQEINILEKIVLALRVILTKIDYVILLTQPLKQITSPSVHMVLIIFFLFANLPIHGSPSKD